VDANGTAFVTDGHAIRRVTATGDVTTVAGSVIVSGTLGGTGSAARFNELTGILLDNDGNPVVADSKNCVIRRYTQVSDIPGANSATYTVNPAGAECGDV